MMTSRTLSLVLLAQAPIPELLDKTRSANSEDRQRAFKALVGRGTEAVPELEAIAKEQDAPARAAAARHALRMIAVPDSLPQKLRDSLPVLAERLRLPDPDEWTQAYLQDAPKLVLAGILDTADVEVLAAGALFGASTPKDRKDACALAAKWSHRAAIPELMSLVGDKDPLA